VTEPFSFQDAQSHFKEWVARDGCAADLLWLFREDVIFLFDRVFIKKPVSGDNESRMAACYELGQERGYGLNLNGFCLLDSQLCCYVALPKDDLEELLVSVLISHAAFSPPIPDKRLEQIER
jgi:hypothetical protein